MPRPKKLPSDAAPAEPVVFDHDPALDPVPEPDARQDAQTAVDPNVLVEVWDRRFNNPNQRGSTEVQLKAPGMVTRWINTQIEGRYHRAVYDQGWQPVPIGLLRDPQSIPDLYKHPHNIVARGERGREVLMMMPKKVFEKIEWKKAELTNASLRKMRPELAQAAATRFGPEAGDFIDRGGSSDGLIKTVGTIQFGTERIPMGSD